VDSGLRYGNAARQLNLYDEAVQVYEAVQAMCLQMDDLGLVWNNLGGLYYEMRRLAEAETALNAALALKRQLAGSGDKKRMADLSSTLTNLGARYRMMQRFSESESAQQEAVSINRDLAGKGWSVAQADLAVSLFDPQLNSLFSGRLSIC
jgi:tetratricopeptide (TPR) repeat protein